MASTAHINTCWAGGGESSTHWICFLVLYVWVIAIQPLATHIMDVGRKSNAEVGILYICSLKMTKMHFRDHFPTVGEIEK